MTKRQSLPIGTRVRIEADPENDLPVQYGTIVDLLFENDISKEYAEVMNGAFTVRLDQKYRDGPFDDGVMDVPAEFITVLELDE